MGRRRKIEGMKRRIKRRLAEFLLKSVHVLLDHTIGPGEKKKRKRKGRRGAAQDALDMAPNIARDGRPT